MTPEDNVVSLNVIKKSWKEKYQDALHEFLVNYLKKLTKRSNPCQVCGGKEWFPHSKNFPTCLAQFIGMPYTAFLLVSCKNCMNTLFFYVDAILKEQCLAFKEDFIKKHGTEEEAAQYGL